MNRDEECEYICNEYKKMIKNLLDNDISASLVLGSILSYTIQEIFRSAINIDLAKDYIKEVIRETVKEWEKKNEKEE